MTTPIVRSMVSGLFGLGLLAVFSAPLAAQSRPAVARFNGVQRIVEHGYSWLVKERFSEARGVLVLDDDQRRLRFEGNVSTSSGSFEATYDQVTNLRYEEGDYPPPPVTWLGPRRRAYLTVHFVADGRSQVAVLHLPTQEAARIVTSLERATGVSVDRSTGLSSFEGVPLYVGIGTRVLITDSAGGRLAGRVSQLSSSAVALDGSPQIVAATISKVELNDPLWNGAVMGFGLGLVGAGSAVLACGLTDDPCSRIAGVAAVAAPLIAGVSIGMLIDKAVRRDVYRASGQTTSRSMRLVPVVSAQTKGAYVQLQF